MKTTLALACLAFASCTAFTAPKDPSTGIRMDAPVSWSGTPDPLSAPGPHFTRTPLAEGRFGHSNKGRTW